MRAAGVLIALQPLSAVPPRLRVVVQRGNLAVLNYVPVDVEMAGLVMPDATVACDAREQSHDH